MRAGRKAEPQVAGGAVQEARRSGRHLDGVKVIGAFFRAQLEEARDRLHLASDVSIARALAAADAAEGPGQRGGRGNIVRRDLQHEARALARGQHLDAERSLRQQRVPDLVDHASRTVACHHLGSPRQPPGAAGRGDAQLEVAAMPGKIERELRQVPGVHPEVDIGAV